MELTIIRHAQSTNNALPDQRWRVVDPPLTEVGVRQAALVAAHLGSNPNLEPGPCETEPLNGGDRSGSGITRLYTSAMRRALQTSHRISLALGLRAEVWVDLHEHGGMWLDHGAPAGIVGYPGLSRSEIMSCFPRSVLPPQVSESGWYDPAQGFESLELASARAERVAARLHEWAALDDRIAVITHGGFSSLLLQVLFGTQPAGAVFFHHDNTGITRLRLRADGKMSLRHLNRISHLPAELVT